MNNLPSFQYFFKSGSKQLDVVLPGFSDGITLPLLQDVIRLSQEQGNSVLAFNYLFFERGEEKSSGTELLEEQKTLKELLGFVEAKQFEHVRLIGKSLGGITASYFLKGIPQEEIGRYSVVVLGYVKDYIDLKSFPGKTVIIQGGKDKNGNVEEVKRHLEGAASRDIEFYGIPGASHGFSDPDTKEPRYYGQVIELLKKL